MTEGRGTPVLSSFWLAVLAFTLSISWLIPNHFLPWPSFHMDAWAGCVMLAGAIVLVARNGSPFSWTRAALVIACLSAVPWLQLCLGLLPFAGQAWMASLYVLALLFSLLMGAHWERAAPGQLPRMLFVAISVAATASVWLQLATWLDIWQGGIFEIWWSMGLQGDRPYANFGQPNLLATLLMWATVGCLWLYLDGKLGGAVALLLAGYFLVGIALTQSRMAWLALTICLVACFIWRKAWPTPRLPWAAMALYAFFMTCPFLLEGLQDLVGTEGAQDFSRLRQLQDVRWAVWKTFLSAIWLRPWLGYGWAELAKAQIAVTGLTPPLHAAFAHTHNLFLDLMGWTGIPLGLAISGCLVTWAWCRVRRVRNAKEAALCMFLGVLGVHAMLELPHQYLYFILPAGAIAGVLEARQRVHVLLRCPRWLMGVMLLGMCIVAALTVHDYLLVEESHLALRFEERRIGAAHLRPGSPPDVVALTHMREWLRAARYQAHPNMGAEEQEWLGQVALAFPSTAALFRMGTVSALNGRPEDARLWLSRICPLIEASQCEPFQRVWAARARADARLAAVTWSGP